MNPIRSLTMEKNAFMEPIGGTGQQQAAGIADMADKGGNLFAAAQDAQRIAIKLGRQQVALGILQILSEEKLDSRAIARIAMRCTLEAK